MGTISLPGIKRPGRGNVTHLDLTPRSKGTGICPLPFRASMACSGLNFSPFRFYGRQVSQIIQPARSTFTKGFFSGILTGKAVDWTRRDILRLLWNPKVQRRTFYSDVTMRCWTGCWKKGGVGGGGSREANCWLRGYVGGSLSCEVNYVAPLYPAFNQLPVFLLRLLQSPPNPERRAGTVFFLSTSGKFNGIPFL